MTMTSTKVTVTGIERNVQVTNPRTQEVKSNTVLNFTVQGTPETKKWPEAYLNSAGAVLIKTALDALTAKGFPVDVVLQEAPDPSGKYLNIMNILPGTTPEVNPRGPAPKKAFSAFSGKGSSGGFQGRNAKNMNRSDALQIAARAAATLGLTTPAAIIEAAKQFETFLAETDTPVAVETAVAPTVSVPVF